MTNTMKTKKRHNNKAKANNKASNKRKSMTTQEYEEMLMEFIKSEFEECI